DGLKPSKGKKNPVTLVKTVVIRKSAVQPSSRFPASMPRATTNPDKIPTRLIATWTKVNVVIPRIITASVQIPKILRYICGNFHSGGRYRHEWKAGGWARRKI